jgi:signal transduction histidine kinase
MTIPTEPIGSIPRPIPLIEAVAAAVFEPFVQVESSQSRATRGTGLGLAISRELARAMRGDLTVESTRSEGSIFTLCQPRAVTPLASPIP